MLIHRGDDPDPSDGWTLTDEEVYQKLKFGLRHGDERNIRFALLDLIRVMRTQNHSDTEILEAVEKALEELKGGE